MRLGVNIDHIATIREARKADEPDPIVAAAICELAGAQGITVHLRGDRRHIQDRDVELLRRTVATHLNVEMAATTEMVRIAQTVKPHQVTLVPERREELTTEGGLDIALHAANVEKVVKQLLDARIDVSIFVDPDVDQIRTCHKIGAPKIEINTGKFADAWKSGNWRATTGSTGAAENSTLVAMAALAAAATKKRPRKTMPLTNWTLESRTLSCRTLTLIHIRRATMNHINAMPAKGIR